MGQSALAIWRPHRSERPGGFCRPVVWPRALEALHHRQRGYRRGLPSGRAVLRSAEFFLHPASACAKGVVLKRAGHRQRLFPCRRFRSQARAFLRSRLHAPQGTRLDYRVRHVLLHPLREFHHACPARRHRSNIQPADLRRKRIADRLPGIRGSSDVSSVGAGQAEAPFRTQDRLRPREERRYRPAATAHSAVALRRGTQL